MTVDRVSDRSERETRGEANERQKSLMLGVNSIESQQTFQQSFYSRVGHPVVLKTLLKKVC